MFEKKRYAPSRSPLLSARGRLAWGLVARIVTRPRSLALSRLSLKFEFATSQASSFAVIGSDIPTFDHNELDRTTRNTPQPAQIISPLQLFVLPALTMSEFEHGFSV